MLQNGNKIYFSKGDMGKNSKNTQTNIFHIIYIIYTIKNILLFIKNDISNILSLMPFIQSIINYYYITILQN